MSYSLIYDSFFIKLSNDTYLPIILSGCNNVTTGYRYQKRARHWSINTFYQDELKLLYAKEELINSVNKNIIELIDTLNKDYAQESRKSWTDYNRVWSLDDVEYYGTRIRSKSATFRDFIKMFENGIKNAFSLEDFLNQKNTFSIMINVYSKNLSKLIDKKEIINIHNESQLLELNEFLLNYKKDDDCSFSIGVNLNYSGYSDDSIRNKPKRNESEIAELKEYFAIQINNYYYLRRKSSKRLFTTTSDSNCKKFKYESQAKKYIEMLKKQYISSNFDIKYINKTI